MGHPYQASTHPCKNHCTPSSRANPTHRGRHPQHADKTNTHPLEIAFGTDPHTLHKITRAPLNPFFSKRAVAALQPRIEESLKIYPVVFEDVCSGMRWWSWDRCLCHWRLMLCFDIVSPNAHTYHSLLPDSCAKIMNVDR